MNIEQCIKNANEAHSSGNSDEAMRWLKKAGSLGDLNAALDYAYFKSGENPAESVEFLNGVSCADNPVVQFHKLQIGYFGEVTTSTSEVAKKAGLMASLSLYLDFINLFVHLLHLLGDRR